MTKPTVLIYRYYALRGNASQDALRHQGAM